MANFDVSNPAFSAEMRMLEKSDPAHANTVNPLFEQLLKNDMALKHIKDDHTGNTFQLGIEDGRLYIQAD